MNSDIVFTEVKEKEDIIFTSCKNNSEIWWNFAFLKRPIKKEAVLSINNFFKERNRVPTIYFPDDIQFDKMSKLLINEGYNISSKDSWMFWDKGIPELDEKGIIEVRSDEDFEKWIETFIKSYPKNDPQNPYGEQTEFAKILRKAWLNKKIKNDKYFLVFDKSKPVAVGILTSYNHMGYISAIGSIPRVRGKGFGKKASLYCIKESFRQGNKIHFLATEKGHFPFDFYERLGFEPKFEAIYYTKP
jgi:ribosomal protein S18 acetylase RimI-like enzyme